MTQTIPEKPATVRMQMDWLRSGKRKLVLVTPGETLPVIPREFATASSELGLFIYDAEKLTEHEISEAIIEDRLGDLLGYGIPNKPEPGTEVGAVTVRAPNGEEKQAVVTDRVHECDVLMAAQRVAEPGDTVKTEPCEQVVEERLKGFLDAFPKLRPIASEEERNQVMAVANEHGQKPVLPTHYVEKDGEIVGAVGISSVPVFTLWLHPDRMKARDTAGILNVIENAYRVNGVKLLGTVIDYDSPFAAVAQRGGYHPEERGKLYWRVL